MSCDPGDADTVADVFGDDLSGTYDFDWVLYGRDATNDRYEKLTLSDTLEVGRGYWIATDQPSQTVNIEDNFNTQADSALVADAAGRSNMVGHRYWYNVPWNDVRVIDGGGVLTLDESDPRGACQRPNPLANGCVMSRIAHKWNGASYDAFDGQTPEMEGTLENFDGLFVKAFKSGISIRIPDNRSTPSAPRPVLAEAPLASTQIGAQFGVTRASELEQQSQSQGLRNGEWFVRLTATDSSGNLIDAGNVLGQLHDSSNRYDNHDLIELEPFGDKYLSMVFPHRDWRAKSGVYTSDYRRVRYNRRSGTWRFDVLSSEPNTEVTLTWAGPEGRIESANLIDDVTGEVIDVQPGGSYTFTTNATRLRSRGVSVERNASGRLLISSGVLAALENGVLFEARPARHDVWHRSHHRIAP